MANVIDILIKAQDQASSVLDKVKASGDKMTESFERSVSASKSAAVGLAAVGAAAGAFIGYGTKIAADLESSRQGFITLLGSADKADAVISQIKKDAAATPFELPGLIAANQLLTSVTKNGQQSEALLMNVGKALAAMGKGQPELDRIIINLQQIGAVGHATLMDVRQFAYNGIPIFEMLSQATGKTGEALSDFISEGGVTFEMLEQMFNDAGMAGGRFADAFTNQAGTFNQLWANMSDTMGIAAAEIVQKSGVFETLKQAVAGVINFINTNKDAITKGLVDGLQWLKDNAGVVAGIIAGMLAPAVISLVISFTKGLLALSPWMIAFGALGLAIQAIITHFGGLQQTLAAAAAFWEKYKVVIIAVGSGLAAVALVILATYIPAIVAGIASNIAFAASIIAAFWPFFLIGAIVGGVIALIITNFDTIKKVAGAVWNWIANAAKAAWNVIWTGIKFIIDLITAYVMFYINVYVTAWNLIVAAATAAWNWIYSNVISPVINLITGAINVMAAIIGYVWQWIVALATMAWNAIYGAIIKPVIDMIVAYIRWYLSIVIGVWNAIVAAAQWAWNGIVAFITPIINAIVAAAQWLGGIIAGVWNNIVNAANWAWGVVRSAAQGAWNWISGIWNGAIGWFSGIVNSIGGAFSGMWNNVKNGAASIWEGIKNTFKGGINWVIDKINWMIDKVNSVADKVPGAPKLGRIPTLASGTPSFSGGQVIVGERGPELIDLPEGSRVHTATQTANMLGKQGVTNNFYGDMKFDSKDTVDYFFNRLNRDAELAAMGVAT